MIERIDQLFLDLKFLSDSQASQAHVDGFRTRSEEFTNLSSEMMVPAKLVELFDQRGLNPNVPHIEARELGQFVDKLIAKHDAEPSSILQSDPNWKHSTKRRIQNLAKQINTGLMKTWRGHIERVIPDVNKGTLYLLYNLPAYEEKASQVRALLSQVKELSQHLPRSLEEIEQPELLANEVRLIEQDIPADIPDQVRALFITIDEGTANATQLSEDIIEWLRDNNLLKGLRISWR